MYVTFDMSRTIFFFPAAIRFFTVSRSVPLSSPRMIRPFSSTTDTPLTSSILNETFMNLTSIGTNTEELPHAPGPPEILRRAALSAYCRAQLLLVVHHYVLHVMAFVVLAHKSGRSHLSVRRNHRRHGHHRLSALFHVYPQNVRIHSFHGNHVSGCDSRRRIILPVKIRREVNLRRLAFSVDSFRVNLHALFLGPDRQRNALRRRSRVVERFCRIKLPCSRLWVRCLGRNAQHKRRAHHGTHDCYFFELHCIPLSVIPISILFLVGLLAFIRTLFNFKVQSY